MSVLTWVESKKMWFNTQTKEWWKICEVCKDHKHLAKFPRCMNCTMEGKK